MEITREQVNKKLLVAILNDHAKSGTHKRMLQSKYYYDIRNSKIRERRKMMTIECEDEKGNTYFDIRDDYSKANNKIYHGHHYELVNQCKNYLSGKPIQYSFKDKVVDKETGKVVENTIDDVNDVLPDENVVSDATDEIKEVLDDVLYRDNDWTTFNQLNIINCQVYGRSWFRVAVNSDNKLKLVILNPMEIIPFYDDFGDLILVIRHFKKKEITPLGNIKEFEYAEIYDKQYKDVWKKVNGWEQIESNVPLMTKVTMYGTEENDTRVVEEVSETFNVFPIIEWKFNEGCHTALEPIKSFIDIMDMDLSDLANNVEDIQDAVWILENYNGQNLAEFMENLKMRKAIKVGEGGSATQATVEIPHEARMKLYEACERNIYKFGFGVDFSKRESLGNVTGVGLKWSYAPLDEKADTIENYGHVALNDLFSVLFQMLNVELDSNDVEFKFDRVMISNKVEEVGMVTASLGLISTKTALENNPLVNDVDEELLRLAEEDEYNVGDEEIGYEKDDTSPSEEGEDEDKNSSSTV